MPLALSLHANAPKDSAAGGITEHARPVSPRDSLQAKASFVRAACTVRMCKFAPWSGSNSALSAARILRERARARAVRASDADPDTASGRTLQRRGIRAPFGASGSAAWQLPVSCDTQAADPRTVPKSCSLLKLKSRPGPSPSPAPPTCDVPVEKEKRKGGPMRKGVPLRNRSLGGGRSNA